MLFSVAPETTLRISYELYIFPVTAHKAYSLLHYIFQMGMWGVILDQLSGSVMRECLVNGKYEGSQYYVGLNFLNYSVSYCIFIIQIWLCVSCVSQNFSWQPHGKKRSGLEKIWQIAGCVLLARNASAKKLPLRLMEMWADDILQALPLVKSVPISVESSLTLRLKSCCVSSAIAASFLIKRAAPDDLPCHPLWGGQLFWNISLSSSLLSARPRGRKTSALKVHLIIHLPSKAG